MVFFTYPGGPVSELEGWDTAPSASWLIRPWCFRSGDRAFQLPRYVRVRPTTVGGAPVPSSTAQEPSAS